MPSKNYAAFSERVSLKEALLRLGRETEIDLAYPSELVEDRYASCQERKDSPESLLDCLLEGTGIHYVRKSGSRYVLFQKGGTQRERRPSRRATISGTVVDRETGEPLPDANVFVDGGKQGTVADEQGRFQLTELTPGRYVVVASVVGYKPARRTAVVGDSAQTQGKALSLRFELRPNPVKLKGVTVEESREEWLGRLEKFRDAFFGTVSNADKCSFVNPEVVSFEKREDLLVAHTDEPLRVRNKALGYEMTYHLSRYRFDPGSLMGRRMRFGPVEFDTMKAETPAQRRAWREARRKAHEGSFAHFVDALQADGLREEGFIVSITNGVSNARASNLSEEISPGGDRVTDSDRIFRPAGGSQDLGLLRVPASGDVIKVIYTREGESTEYAQRYRRGYPSRNRQVSWIQFFKSHQVLFDLQTGGIVQPRSGYFLKKGYWGWHETAATALPRNYQTPEAG